MTIAETFPNGLRVPQIVGALRIQQQRRMLLADQPGAGKTAQAMVALEIDGLFERRSNILILCNITGCQLTWSPEIHRRVIEQYPNTVFADLTNPGRDRRGRAKKTMPSVKQRDDALFTALTDAEETDAPLIVLANYESLQIAPGQQPKMVTMFGITFDAVIIDESHLVLPTEKDHIREVTQVWRGLMSLHIKDDGIRLSLSGTPDRGRLERRYGHWKFLFPTQHQNYWGWAKSHFVVTYEKVGYNPKMNRDIMAAKVGKLRDPGTWKMFDEQRMIRRTKAEMLKGLPEKQWADDGGIDLPMTPLQQNAYDDWLADTQAKIEAALADEDDRTANGLRMQITTRLQQMATCTWDFVESDNGNGTVATHGVPRVAGRDASNKLAWILDWLDTRGYRQGEDFDIDGGKVVIVSYHVEVLKWLQAELAAEGMYAEVLAGETSAPDKSRIEQAFQRGELRIVLLSGFVGVSINLDAADDMIFVGLNHDPDRMEQAEDRIHRASRNHQVTYWRLISEGTVDTAVVQVIDSRYRNTRRTYDGDRGVEFARRMLPKIEHTEQGALA